MEETPKSNEIFISYRRADVEFTQKIYEGLKQTGLTVWVDWDDIPPGVEGFTDEIQRGIEGAVAFICILSPSYLESEYCLMELKEAIRLKKRVVPIVLKKFEPMPAPEGIGHINWVYFTPHAGQQNTYEESFPKVIQAIKADYEHSREHTRLLVRAIDWEKNDKGTGYVLKGAELDKAERWQAASAGKNPEPTALQGEYILASRKDAARRSRITLTGVTIALVVSIALGVLAWFQRQAAVTAEATAVVARNTAVAAEGTAVANEQEAKRQAQIALARQLAAQAQINNLGRNANQSLSVLLAAQSLKMSSSNEAASFLINNNFAAIPVASNVQPAGPSAFAATANGWYVATATCDVTNDQSTTCSIIVTEAATGREVINISTTHEGWVNTIDMNPDGSLIATGSEDGTACIWETATGAKIACMGHNSPVSIVKFSPDGKYVGSIEGREVDIVTHVWDSATGNEVANLPEGGNVLSIAFNPTSTQLATGAYGDVEIWDIASRRLISIMHHELVQGEVVFQPQIASVAFSSDGKYVLSGSWDTTARVWDIATRKEVARMTHDARVRTVAFSPVADVAASAGEDGIVRVWSISSGKEIVRMVHNDIVEHIAFSPDGNYILSQSLDDTARVWNVATGGELARMTHEGGVGNAAFSPDSKYVASTGGEGTVRVWMIANTMMANRLVQNDTVNTFAFSPDGKYIALGTDFVGIHILELASGREIASINDAGDYVVSLAFSPDGKYVVAGSGDRLGTVWETATGNKVSTMTHDDGNYGRDFTATFSPDGKYVITHGEDYTVRTWNPITGEEIERKDLQGQNAIITNGTYLVVGNEQNDTLPILDADGKELVRINNDEFPMAISPTGEYLVTKGGPNNTFTILHVREISTGKEIASMVHASNIEAVAISSDGQYIASGENDRTAHIWETSTGIEVARITGNSTIISIGFSPDGRYVAASGCDQFATKYCTEGSVRMWSWQPKDLISNACSVMLRNLTLAEWEQYIGTSKPYETVCDNLPSNGQIATLMRDAPLTFEEPNQAPANVTTDQPETGAIENPSMEASVTTEPSLTGDVILEDDFSSPNWGTGTDADSSLEYVSDALQMIVYKANWFVWSTPNDKDYSNVHMEVTVINNDTDSTTAFGLICNKIDDSDFYYFAITPAGQYAIAKAASGQKDLFLSNNDTWKTSNLITPNALSYRLGADCNNGTLTLYVDGKQIDSVSDSTYTSGGVALFVWSGEDATTANITYDDFLMTKLSLDTESSIVTGPTTLGSQNTFTEEFDGNMDSWSMFMTSGIDRQVKTSLEGGKLEVKLLISEDRLPRAYWIHDSSTYNNVQVEAVVTNNGNNSNGVSLICQYSDVGWYEFVVSNTGLYTIYAFDPSGSNDERYHQLVSGDSMEIQSGLNTNIYTAVCNGNELGLSINGVFVNSFTDTIFNLTEGKIGFGASSPQMLPIDVIFDSLSVSIPK